LRDKLRPFEKLFVNSCSKPGKMWGKSIANPFYRRGRILHITSNVSKNAVSQSIRKNNNNYHIGKYIFIFAILDNYLMRVIAKKILREFWKKHADSEDQLKTWFKEASKAHWSSPNDIKNDYSQASILKASRVVFNICGNNYRLIVKINYQREWVFIRFIGTHAEYDKIDAEKI